MPKKDDEYIVALGETHLEWGIHGYNRAGKREAIKEEGYLKIPRAVAIDLDIYMSNKKDANTIYNFSTNDNFYKNEKLLASGCSAKGDIYAKNLAGHGNLKLLGKWFTHIKANVGDEIKISFTSPTDIILSKV